MKRSICLVAFIASVAPAPPAHGHGTPIHVEVVDTALVASGGFPDADGFAPMIFLEDDEDGDPFGTLTLPTLGPVIVWQLPGFDIFGMDDQSNLSIEVLMRPAKNSNPVAKRLLWYWNPQTESVEPPAAPFHLLGTGMRFQTLTLTDTVAPPPFMLADPIAGQQGFHNHSLLSYALDNDPPPPAGAYGFFARLTSDLHAASDPFLLVFNHGVDPMQMPSAGLAINAAAFLPGDYNHDDHVDAADYVTWRETFGSTTALAADGSGNLVVDEADYGVWRTHFGRVFGGSGAAAPDQIAPVPEPGGVATATGLLVTLATWIRQRVSTVTAVSSAGNSIYAASSSV